MIRRITDSDILGIIPSILINSVSRYASRGVLVDTKLNVVMMYMSELNLYTLPGGGVEEGEDSEKAFLREILEETGFEAEIIHELGYIEEHKNHNNFMQYSYCYIAKAIKFIDEVSLSESEIKLGMETKWLTIETALEVMNHAIQSCEDYSDKFMILRDKTILEEAATVLDKNDLHISSGFSRLRNHFNRLDYPNLCKEICWGSVTARFEQHSQLPDEKLISNVSLIPFIGDKCVMMHINNKDWELPGGTLEPSELWYDAIRRETMEELGAKLIDFHIIGAFYCTSIAEHPYRSHIPHPNFIRIVGYGEVTLIGKPLNPADGENVTKVEAVGIDEAIGRFETAGRQDIAELYKMANHIRWL